MNSNIFIQLRKHLTMVCTTTAESAPHRRHVVKACDNNTQTSPTTWCFGEDWQHAGGARDLNPAIPIDLQEFCLVTAQSHFRAVNTLAFGLQEVVLPSSARFMVSGELLQQLGVFPSSYRNPKTGLPHAPRPGFGALFLVSPAQKNRNGKQP